MARVVFSLALCADGCLLLRLLIDLEPVDVIEHGACLLHQHPQRLTHLGTIERATAWDKGKELLERDCGEREYQ